MLIISDEQRLLAGVVSMSEQCKYCSKACAEYPRILSDDADQIVYHAACAVQLANSDHGRSLHLPQSACPIQPAVCSLGIRSCSSPITPLWIGGK